MDGYDIDFFIQSGICPICKMDLVTNVIIERHDDNIAHNQTISITKCPTHGDINEIDFLEYLEDEDED